MNAKPTTCRRRGGKTAVAIAMLLALLTVACGNKGDLVLPEEPPRATAQP